MAFFCSCVTLLEMTGVFKHTVEHAQNTLGEDLEHYVGSVVGVTNDGDFLGQPWAVIPH